MLLVEPDYLLADAAATLFKAYDVIVTVAPDAKIAVDFVAQVHFDCILIDVDLWEGADGVDLAKRIARQFPRSRVALSTGLDASSVDAPHGIPIFQKPYRFDTLVAAFCGRKRSEV